MALTPEEITARMAAINAYAPIQGDGVWWFNKVYLQSRVNVLSFQGFSNPAYIRQLDVAFGRRWLIAYDAAFSNPHNIPTCWRPLFINRDNPRILPIQFVVAGLIAHIFRDLTLANFEITNWFEVIPNKLFLSAKWRDYQKVNGVLSQTMRNDVLPELRDEYDSEIIEAINFIIEPFLASTGAVSIAGSRLDAWDRGMSMRLLHPFVGTFGGSAQDAIYSAEAAALAKVILTPILAPIP
jgi:hypothetical protein